MKNKIKPNSIVMIYGEENSSYIERPNNFKSFYTISISFDQQIHVFDLQNWANEISVCLSKENKELISSYVVYNNSIIFNVYLPRGKSLIRFKHYGINIFKKYDYLLKNYDNLKCYQKHQGS